MAYNSQPSFPALLGYITAGEEVDTGSSSSASDETVNGDGDCWPGQHDEAAGLERRTNSLHRERDANG